MSLITGRSAYGDVTFYGKDEYIGRSFYAYGEWSGDECDFLRAECNGLFIDVGANIGAMSMAILAAGHPVVAFEPQPALFSLLQKNCPNATCYNMALSSVAGIAKMPRISYSEKGNYGGVGFGRSALGSIEVKCVTLDSLDLAPALIKIDVEGHELEVLKGARETILRHKPMLYVEDDREDKRAALQHYIKELGYTMQYHTPKMYRDNNFKGFRRNIWDEDYMSMNLICRPC